MAGSGDRSRGEIDERALVDAARNDPEAFAALYRRHLPHVHAFALRRSGSRAVAEDVTAATFERALRNLDRYDWRPPGIRPWLCRIAANELAEHHRREARRRERETAAVRKQWVGDDPPAIEGDDELLAALSSLRPRYQEVLSLRYLADLDHDEVATALGVTRPHLAVVLMRARTALRKAMEGGMS